jgi:hypothetical protein
MELNHDPRTKMVIKDTLYEYLYEPVLASYRRKLKELIVANCKLTKTSHLSFMYRGHHYIAEGCEDPIEMGRVALLAPELKGAMDEYLNDTAYLNTHELPYVLGYLNSILNLSDDLPDYLKLLPDSMHQPLKEMIASCKCKTSHLDEATVKEIREKNSVPIQLIKQRLTLNLLLSN